MTDDVQSDDFVNEFKDLLHKVSEDVSRAAVLPAVVSAHAAWAAKLDDVLKIAQTNQSIVQSEFASAFQRVLEEVKTSQDTLCKAAVAESGAAESVKTFIEQALKAEQSIQQATGQFDASCKSVCKVITAVRDDFTGATSSVTWQLNSKLTDILDAEKDFSLKAGMFSEELIGRLKAVNVLLSQAKASYIESQKPVFWGLTPRGAVTAILVCNVLLLLFSVLRLVGVKM
jgi:hypothetical protein